MSELKIFEKSFNSYSRKHEFHDNRENAESLSGTGHMKLVNFDDYKTLQKENAKLLECVDWCLKIKDIRMLKGTLRACLKELERDKGE